MLNNFIGGGQVFLHKVRMFKQVAGSTFKLALLIGICITVFLGYLSLRLWIQQQV